MITITIINQEHSRDIRYSTQYIVFVSPSHIVRIFIPLALNHLNLNWNIFVFSIVVAKQTKHLKNCSIPIFYYHLHFVIGKLVPLWWYIHAVLFGNNGPPSKLLSWRKFQFQTFKLQNVMKRKGCSKSTALAHVLLWLGTIPIHLELFLDELHFGAYESEAINLHQIRWKRIYPVHSHRVVMVGLLCLSHCKQQTISVQRYRYLLFECVVIDMPRCCWIAIPKSNVLIL